jgi:tetratricopeptide (TPR) repeat protein
LDKMLCPVSRRLGGFCLALGLAAWSGPVLAAQAAAARPAHAAPNPAAPALAPLPRQAQGDTDFALGKLAEAEAERAGGGPRVEAALKYFTAAMAADPGSAYIASQMADLLSRIGRTAEAVSLAQSVVKQHPDDIRAHATLGEIYLRELSRARQPIPAKGDDAMAGAMAEYKRLIELDPRDADYVVMLGKLYGAQGRAADAEAQFRKALTLNPTDMDAVASLVQSLANQNRLDEAAREIAALPPEAQGGEVYATLGNAYLTQHRYAEAAGAFRQAVAADPEAASYRHSLGRALMQGGDYAGALAAYQRLLASDPTDGDAALRIGQLQMQLGHLPAAAASLKAAAALLSPANVELGYAQALLEESEGHNAPALAKLRALAARKNSATTESIFLTQLARLEMRAGQAGAAEADLTRLEALGGSSATQARQLRVTLYSQQRQYPQAVAAARAALADRPGSRSLRLTYANLLAAAGHPGQAKLELAKLLKGTAADWDVYLARGNLEAQARQWDAGRADLLKSQALAPNPAGRARALTQLGQLDARQKRFAAAEQRYRQALQLAPNDPVALNALGYLYAQQGVHLPEALADVRQAVAQDVDNGAYLDSLGWVYFKMNRLPQALTSLQRAAALQRHNPAILDHLAQAYEGNGQLEQAASSWSRALQDLKQNPAADSGGLRADQIRQKLDAVRNRIARSKN